MSQLTRRAKRLVLAGGIAAAAVAGVLTSAQPVVAAGPHPTPPGQTPTHHAVTTSVNPADNGTSVCSGGASHAVKVKTSDIPLDWNSGTQTVSQSIRTYHSQGKETLVVTFSGEAYADSALAWIQADVLVDGHYIEPYDSTSVNAFKSGATYANASLTRCVRVSPGNHKVKVELSAVGTGYAWVDDYALRIDQYN